ncbi:uncharacterized protein LOC18437780 isoform X2 [Amborella trichopoda]|uniref:uncharacterized protein LOC18437780 isoform X2 n=1 Tax=Amborella trichopoda TaxID=13333 RepID=UPI0005D433AB|nr:uncharacterized protein LOC18437780 isoform X2 [Amborella trichopoda]|eukprot:XP_011624697.1 uncharacterized protein LOC18437780 isoform X2 [Amborella trichopoda]
MATALSRAGYAGFLSRSLSLFTMRTFSTASTSAPSESAQASAQKKPKRRKKKNLFEVAQFLPNWGIGYQLAKNHWAHGFYYQITKVNLYKDGRHDVPTAETPNKISGVHKRGWRYIPHSKKTIKDESRSEVQA